jgi:hypothetical protein
MDYSFQHMVTEAILRRWTDRDSGEVSVFFREEGRVGPADTAHICGVEGFVRFDAEKTEQTWSKYETRLGEFYKSIDKTNDPQELLNNHRFRSTAREILALHTARSFTVQDVAEVARISSKAGLAVELVEQFPAELADMVARRYPYLNVPVTRAVLLDEASRAIEHNGEIVAPGGELFRARVVLHFRSLKQRFAETAKGLELFIPKNPKLEFVIGDDPVLQPSSELDGRFGLLDGVHWDEARTFLMPFTPRLAVGLGREDHWEEVDDDAITWINRGEIRYTRRHLVARPGSGMAEWAAELLGSEPNGTAA